MAEHLEDTKVNAPDGPGRESDEQFRRMVETVQEYGLFLLDTGGNVTSWNAGAQRIKGFKAEEIIGRHFSVFYPPQDVAAGKPLMELKLAAELGRWEDEGWRVRADGTRFWANVLITALKDDAGNLCGFSKLVRDFTERKRAEEALRESEGRLRAIVETAVDGIITIDERGNVTSFNPAAVRLFGYKPQEIVGKNVNLLIPAPYHAEHDGHLHNYLATGITRIIGTGREVVGLRKDGSRFPMYLAVSETVLGERRIFTGILRDITERKRAEETLRASEGRLKLVTDNARVGLVMVDRDRRYTFANATYAQILGLASADIVGQRVADVLAPLYEEQIRPRLDRAFAGERVAYELRKPDPAGDRCYAVRYEPPILDGAVSIVVVVITDITERTRAEEALRKSEAQLQTIVENIDEAVVVSDLNGKLLHFNRAALDSLGYAGMDEGRRLMTELVDTFELSATDGTPWTVEQWPLARILRGEALRDLEGRMRRTGTEWDRVFSFGGNLAHDAAGTPLMAIVTFSDITERKRAEASLREGEERFRTMANCIPQLAWIARPDGFIFWYNQRWYEYTGTTQEQMQEWGWQSVHDPQVLPKVIDRWKAAIECGEPFEMEFPLRGANRGFRTFLTRVQPLKNSQGQLVQWFGTNTDVEALKQAEEKVRQLNADLERRVVERTAQLQSANKELEAFSYSVSHDLRAPLRGLDGFSQALLEDYADKLDDQGRQNLQRIRAASQRMGQLIDDLLNLSRVTRVEMRRETVDMSKMAAEIAAELRAAEPGRQAQFLIADRLSAQADARLLRIILTNLLGNAWKFTGKRNQSRIEVGCSIDNGINSYFVRDNGAGFSMRYAEKLFGAFQRLHQATEFPGTGIGLATVQRIVHRHGGRIWAMGEPDVGASFHFTLQPPLLSDAA